VKRVPLEDDTDSGWLLNLHDCFLTANLMRTLMDKAPLPAADPDEWATSDRGRLERCWHRDLFVLVEAWERLTAERHEQFRAWAPEAHDAVAAMLKRDDMRKVVGYLHATRDYMSHRDQRRYWNAGRYAAAQAGVELPRTLNLAFGRFFLEALRARGGA
jgi:hypothetical protein